MNACDLVVAADDSYFASAYRQIALTPDGGGSWALPRLVGLRKAMEIFLLGERFGAADALALGLVNRVVPAAELDAATSAIVQALATGPVLALRNAKRLVRESLSRIPVRAARRRGVELRALAPARPISSRASPRSSPSAPQFGHADRMTDLAGRTLFITGGSRGIGLAIARARGARRRQRRDRREDGRTASQAAGDDPLGRRRHRRGAGGRALPIACDIRDEDAVQAAVKATAAHFGGIDILVNNASAISLTGTAATPMKRFDLMFGVNVRGTFPARRPACRT